ncbi:hypothetical protein L1987_11518 [Smallanthus sonchifolius]|uniref:Uncharacterized protein n=1 Tax=Smallanthus sonchifolius TaxID=185202 RepID=A0ACB9JD98_9ASTR|nr:hypothetical protein L1987_11518 [Smallanthus sonchifolius]
MGLDEPPRQQRQQAVYRQQRGFSENYLERVASIGSHEKRSRTIRQKPKIKKDSTNNDSPVVDSQTRNVQERNDLAAKSVVLRPNLGNVKRESRPLFLLDSHIGWEFKKQLLERSKRTKVCQEIWSSKHMVDLELKKRSEVGTRVVISNYDGWKDKSVTKLLVFKQFNRSSSGKTKFKIISKGDLRLSSVGCDEHVSANSQDAEFSCSFNVPFEKELPCEERFTSLNCIDVNDEFTRSTGEAYQPSPNSVLEPDNSSSSEYGESVCTDLHVLNTLCLWMKLQILKSESEENQSNKSESVALSKEDASERSVSIGQNTKPIRCFGPEESQRFLYLVNVLNEMGFHGGNVELNFERFMTNPIIFKTLEKKYENEESWNKADRRLLFDRINLGLTEIVWSKSLRRKMSNVLRRDVVEEELWNMLLSQEKEVNVDLSKNSVWEEPWLELRDEVDSIVVEIEAFLFNELAAELGAI